MRSLAVQGEGGSSDAWREDRGTMPAVASRTGVAAAPALLSCVGVPSVVVPAFGGFAYGKGKDPVDCGKRAQALLIDTDGASSRREAKLVLVLKLPALELDGGD